MASKTLLLSEDFKNNAVLNSVTPGGLGAVQSGFSIARQLRGAASSGIGWSGLINGFGSAIYNVNLAKTGAQPDCEIDCWIMPLEFDVTYDGDSTKASSILTIQPTLTEASAATGGGGGQVMIRGDGFIGIVTNAGTAWGPQLVKNTWYKIIFERITSYPNNDWGTFLLYVGAVGNPIQCVCALDSINDAAALYAGIRAVTEEGGGNGAKLLISGYAVSSKTRTVASNQTPRATCTSGSPIVSNLATTTGWLAGDVASMPGIPLGTTIASVDSSSQVHLSANSTTTFSASGYGPFTYRGVEAPGMPALNDPSASAVTVYCRQDAVGGGDGSANDAAHALTYHELCSYAGNSIGLKESWAYFGGAFDPTTQGAVDIAAGFLAGNFAWTGDKAILGTDIQVASPSGSSQLN